MFESIVTVKGQVRPVFRFLISIAALFVVVAGIGILVGLFPPPFHFLLRQQALLFWSNLLLFPALLLLYKALTFFLDRKPFASVGLAFYPQWKGELAMGLIAGAVMIGIVAAIEWIFGAVKFGAQTASAGTLASTGSFLFAVLLISAIDEELLFRGYPFQRLIDSIGAIPAIIAFSVLFGAAHLSNPDHTWISTANTVLVGVLFAVCYLRTRALWLPIGIHFAWNYTQGFLLGFPVSGLKMPAPLMKPGAHGALWLTGGAYGPEGSILTTAVILAGTVFFMYSSRLKISAYMQKLALGESESCQTARSNLQPEIAPADRR